MLNFECVKCPHCQVAFYDSDRNEVLVNEGIIQKRESGIEYIVCPGCNGLIVWVIIRESVSTPGAIRVMVYPRGASRQPVSADVPDEFAKDYSEACLVIADSPKASAALSRRCLQHILREKAKVNHPNDLAKAIQEVVNDPGVPSDISKPLGIVRNIGNFSAHPNKSKSTGEIVDVEPGEAEWCLDIIEILFDFYFVTPANVQRRTLALNEKLADMGKPQMPIGE